MDITQEISNHLEWVDSVASLLGNFELLDEDYEEITQHDKCKLGEWLNSAEASVLKDYAEFDALVESHEIFHLLAGALIATAVSGNEEESLGVQQEFLEKSHEVIGHLQNLQAIMATK